MVLHRPYLRADPAAYPESADMCLKAALMILSAYRVGSSAKASIFWSWWTMSYRVSAVVISHWTSAKYPGLPCWCGVRLFGDPRTEWNAGQDLHGERYR
jgi:hypothetical protein